MCFFVEMILHFIYTSWIKNVLDLVVFSPKNGYACLGEDNNLIFWFCL
jgi:hypothetical protein